MKLIYSTVLLLFLFKIVSAVNPIKTVEVIEDASERFADDEIPVRVIEVQDDDSLTIRADEDDPYRLPTSVVPRSYTLVLILQENFGPNGVFSGSVSITLDIQEAVQEITLQAQYLAINSNNIILTCDSSTESLFESLSNDTAYHKITIRSKSQIAAGSSCTLQINNYEGILDDDMRGLYRSSYTNQNGEIE